MLSSLRQPAALVSCCLAALVLAGCGGAGRAPGGDAGGAARGDAGAQGTEDAGVDGRDRAQEAMPPAQVAAIERRLDALVAAYAPVSARVNFLVSAETLRADATDSKAGAAIELERTGAVRVELRRLRAVLLAARPKVATAAVASEVQRQVQQRMLAAIRARVQSLRHLEAALDAIAAEHDEGVVDQRFAAWEEAWGSSLREAREATTVVQAERARVGLGPAPEESIR